MSDDLEFSTVDAAACGARADEVRALLADRGLTVDPGVGVFVVGLSGGHVVACAGLDGDIVKCVAVSSRVQGRAVLPTLMTEVGYVALERGHAHLICFTKPEYEAYFAACGYRTVVDVPGHLVMMENTPRGIGTLARSLRRMREQDDPVPRDGRVGAIVLNANPFTLGHAHLVGTAARECERLHVFVVAEDASQFAAADRLALVREGVAALPGADRIRVHEGSRYVVSRATFPTYFLKDPDLVDECATAADLRIFRRHIAPALGVTHRYVGTEPLCAVTRRYNADMHRWLEAEPDPAPPVAVVEVPRLTVDGDPVSATRVRRLAAAHDLDALARLVPPTTLRFLRDHPSTPVPHPAGG